MMTKLLFFEYFSSSQILKDYDLSDDEIEMELLDQVEMEDVIVFTSF